MRSPAASQYATSRASAAARSSQRRVEHVLHALVHVELEVLRAQDRLVGGRLPDAALEVGAGVDAGHEAGGREGEELAVLAGARVGDLHPGVVDGGVAGVVLGAKIEGAAAGGGLRLVEDGEAVLERLAVGDEVVVDGGVEDAAAGDGVGRHDDGDVVHVPERVQARGVGLVGRVALVVGAGRGLAVVAARERLGDGAGDAGAEQVLGQGGGVEGRAGVDDGHGDGRLRIGRLRRVEEGADEGAGPLVGRHVGVGVVRVAGAADGDGELQLDQVGVGGQRLRGAGLVEERGHAVHEAHVVHRAGEVGRGGHGRRGRLDERALVDAAQDDVALGVLADEVALARHQGDADPERVAEGAGVPRPHLGERGGRGEAQRRIAAGVVAGVRRGLGREGAGHVEALAAVVEEGAGGVGRVVDLRRVGGLAVDEVLQAAIAALELAEAGDNLRPTAGRAEAGLTDEAAGAGAHPLQEFGSEADFFDVDTGRQILGHRVVLRLGSAR
jgi:hypothetical protein